MTTPARVMVVDDSVVVRRALTTSIESGGEFAVVATLPNGALALSRLETTEVDAVLLDIEMPEMDGLETLRRIRAKWPRLPVIMCSTLTERGAAVTLDALTAGATDYVTKPSGTSSYAAALEALREELLRKLRAVVGARREKSGRFEIAHEPLARRSAPRSVAPVLEPPPTLRDASAFVRGDAALPSVLAIASSTGGPNALLDLWAGLPRPFPVPIVMVQHMPPIFTRMLAERLTASGGIRVSEGAQGERLGRGEARIAPGGFHMEISGTVEEPTVRIHEEAPENSCRPAADVLFRSVARVYGPRVLGVVLTGMGQDALVGSRAIVEAGGRVIVQDEATSVVWGMPGFVARAGLAREILPLREIAGAIRRSFRLQPEQQGRDEHRRERLPVRP